MHSKTKLIVFAAMTLMSASAFSMSGAMPCFSPIFAQSLEDIQTLLEEAAKMQAEMSNAAQPEDAVTPGSAAETVENPIEDPLAQLEDIIKSISGAEEKEPTAGKDDLAAAKSEFENIIFARELSEEEIEKYVEKGGDINDDFNIGPDKTKLILAIADLKNKLTFPNPDKLIEALVKNGADINIKNENEQHALLLLAGKTTGSGFGGGDLERATTIIEALLDNGINVNDKDETGNTALLYVIQNPICKDIVKLLVENGADVNAVDKDGASVLMIAAKTQNKETLELLIENGADIEAKDSSGKTALDYAATNSRQDIRELFAKNEDDPAQENPEIPSGQDATDESASVAENDNDENIDELEEEDGEIKFVVNDANMNQATKTLISLIERNELKPDTLKKLAERGANVNVRLTGNGITTYPLLLFSDFSDVRDFMVATPGTPYASPGYKGKVLAVPGPNPRDVARQANRMGQNAAEERNAKREKSSMVFTLFWGFLEAGANPNVRTSKGESMLDIVLRTFVPSGYGRTRDQEDIEQWLLLLNILKEKGANFADADHSAIGVYLSGANHGSTSTSAKVQLQVIKFLMGAGADINAKLEHGKSILMLAIQVSQDQELLQGLIDLGADLTAEDENGKALPDYVPEFPSDTANYKVGEWLKQKYHDKAGK